PMLKSRIRNAAAAARPVNARGVAAISVWPIAPLFTNAASKMSLYAGSGWCPVGSSPRPDAKNATTIAPAGTANISHRGCRSRRSILTGVVPSRHLQADVLDPRIGAGRNADDRPFVHHGDAVCQGEDLVEVL